MNTDEIAFESFKGWLQPYGPIEILACCSSLGKVVQVPK